MIELRALRRRIALPLCLLLLSCEGDVLFEEPLSPFGCVVTERRPLDLDQGSPLGFSAEDVVAFALGHFEAEFAWGIPPEYGGLSLTPEAGDTTLSVDLGSEVVGASFVVRGMDDAVDGTLDQCFDAVELETQVRLVTGNGAFDEILPIVLSAENVSGARASVQLEPGSFVGAFALDETGPVTVSTLDNQPDRSELSGLSLELDVTPGRVAAAMTANYNLFFGEGPTGGVSGASVTFGQTAERQQCYTEDFGGALDGGEAVSRLAARLGDPFPLQFNWTEEVLDRALTATIEATSFCVATFGLPSLWFSAEVELRDPESGELFATWPLDGRVSYFGDGRFDRITLTSDEAYLVNTFDPAELAQTIGDFGVDFSGADAVGFQVSLELDTEEIWSGELILHAIQTVPERDPPCQSEPVASDAGAGSCSGAPESSRVVASAMFSEIVR